MNNFHRTLLTPLQKIVLVSRTFLILCWCGIMCLVGILSFLFSPSGTLCLKLYKPFAKGIFWLGNIKFSMHGNINLKSQEPCIYICNHESALDIPALLLALPPNLIMISKKSLRLVPLLGWAMKMAGFIFIDQKNRTNAYKSLDTAIMRLKKRSVVIFPEGKRGDGHTLLPFKRGTFVLSQKTGLPIVPIGIYGAHFTLAKEQWFVRPGHIWVCIGEPVLPPKEERDVVLFRQKMFNIVHQLKKQAEHLNVDSLLKKTNTKKIFHRNERTT